MASSEKGTEWELLNYVGELFSADPTQTPFLTAIGGLNGAKLSKNFEFPCSVEADYPAASQPDISEDTSKTAPAETDITNTQTKNVCQIQQYAVEVTYGAIGSRGRLSGIATDGATPVQVVSDYDVQIARHLTRCSRDTEYSFLQGTYQISTDSDVSCKTRGLIEAASDASNTVAAGGAALSKALIKSLILTMAGNGALFRNTAFIVNAFQNFALSELYGYAPTDRMVGGVALKQIAFDIAGFIGIMYDPIQPTDTVTIADLGVCAPVMQEIPGKGMLFYEPLAKLGAAERGQVYGRIGLDHGPNWCHGTITGLATS